MNFHQADIRTIPVSEWLISGDLRGEFAMGITASKRIKGGSVGIGKGGAHAQASGKRGSVKVGKKGVKAKVKIPGTGISINKKIK